MLTIERYQQDIMMLMSSYVHYLKTFRIREGSFRDFLDSVSVEISEKQMQ